MALEDILNRIQLDAQQSAQLIKDEASKQSAKIIAQAQEKAEQTKQDLLKRVQHSAEEEKRQIMAIARLELRKQLLSKKQRQIETAFVNSLEYLRNLNDDEYGVFMKQLLLDAVQTREETVILVGSKRQQIINEVVQDINTQINGSLVISQEVRTGSGGFILQWGKKEMNYSFEAMLHQIKEEITYDVASILFQGK
ncbi:MAG: V-type ATP synthase subunit E [Candidatus Desantisbacteria bacterium]